MADAFGRYWAAATTRSFGTAVTTVAMPVLVIQDLDASAFSVGVVNAAQFLPYAVLGLVAGVYADRYGRQRILVWSSLGRAATLGALPVLWAFGALEVGTLVVLLLAFGAFSVFAFAASLSCCCRAWSHATDWSRPTPALIRATLRRKLWAPHSEGVWLACSVRRSRSQSMRLPSSWTRCRTPGFGLMSPLADRTVHRHLGRERP